MKRFTCWVTPAYPVIAAPTHVELKAGSVEHAVMQLRARYPNCAYSMPRPDGPDYVPFQPAPSFDDREAMASTY